MTFKQIFCFVCIGFVLFVAGIYIGEIYGTGKFIQGYPISAWDFKNQRMRYGAGVERELVFPAFAIIRDKWDRPNLRFGKYGSTFNPATGQTIYFPNFKIKKMVRAYSIFIDDWENYCRLKHCGINKIGVKDFARILYYAMTKTPGYKKITKEIREKDKWKEDWQLESEELRNDWYIVAKAALDRLES